MGSRLGRRQEFRKEGEVVADVLQHVHEQDEPGLAEQGAEVRRGPPLEKMDLGEAGAARWMASAEVSMPTQR